MGRPRKDSTIEPDPLPKGPRSVRSYYQIPNAPITIQVGYLPVQVYQENNKVIVKFSFPQLKKKNGKTVSALKISRAEENLIWWALEFRARSFFSGRKYGPKKTVKNGSSMAYVYAQ